MTELEIESDAFLSLLTDALRSGPGSPAWHESLRKLRAGGMAQADEYRLLVKAREHLESGKDYRSIRAGPGFAQKLMAAIDEDTSRGANRPPASAAVAVASAAIMLLVLLVIGYLLWTAAEHRGGDSGLLLSNVVSSPDLVALPPDWHRVGQSQVAKIRDRSVISSPSHVPMTSPGVEGGGIVWNESMPPTEPFAISVTVRVRHIEPDLIAQVVVSDDPDFSAVNGTTSHEFTWLLEGLQTRVISPSGRVELQTTIPDDNSGFIPLRVTIDHDQASIDLENKRVWSGPNELDQTKPRYIGLRFLRRSANAGDGVVFQSLRINTRPK